MRVSAPFSPRQKDQHSNPSLSEGKSDILLNTINKIKRMDLGIPTLPFARSQSRKMRKVISLLAITGAYVQVFLLLYPVIGSTVGTLVTFPVIVGGMFLGLWVGLIAGLLSFPLNILLYNQVGIVGSDVVFQPGGAPAMIILLVVGGVVGRLCDLHERAEIEINERKQAEIALKETHNELYRRNEQLKSEIARRNQVEQQLHHDAFHDALTGLANRALFMEHLKRSINRMKRREDYLFAVLFLDIDRFKNVNDSLGHIVGDQLLIAIARRLKSGLRPVDLVARLGGDEFAILLDGIEDTNSVLRVAKRVQKQLASPFSLIGHEIFITASVGIAQSTMSYERPENFLRDADLAMYHAKEKGKARYEVFDKDMHQRALTRLQLETDLQRAVERNEFQLNYQPTISLDTGKISGFEALIRWKHPARGCVYPGEFIPIAEETGLIISIDYWALREACFQMKTWLKQLSSQSRLSISVNISGKHFMQPDLVEGIYNVLQESGLDPSRLGLEITESAVMENVESTIYRLSQLKSLGVQLLVDDFGTGYSSLSYLHRFPIDVMKIDNSFIREIGVSDGNLEIVRTITSLAHNLGVDVLAEGIENNEQLEHLRAMKCEYGQGFYFSKPVNVDKACELISKDLQW